MEEQIWHKFKWPPEVPHSLTYEPQPLFKVLDETAQKYPNRPYTIFADHEQTYRQIQDMADRVATFLVRKGIQRGDRVALFLPNVPHFPVTFFGALKSGAVCVTCNPLYKANELNFQLKDCGAKALFVLDHPVIYPTALEALKGNRRPDGGGLLRQGFPPSPQSRPGRAAGQDSQGPGPGSETPPF